MSGRRGVRFMGMRLPWDDGRIRGPFTISSFNDDLSQAVVVSPGCLTTLMMNRPNGGIDFRTYPMFKRIYRRAVKLRHAEMVRRGWR